MHQVKRASPATGASSDYDSVSMAGQSWRHRRSGVFEGEGHGKHASVRLALAEARQAVAATCDRKRVPRRGLNMI